MANSTRRVTLPRIDTSTAWLRNGADETVETRLRTAVAEVLGLEEGFVQMIDSFVDLGGDKASAMALRKACMNVGMAVKTKDILGCQTLAELQTHITPCARQSLGPTTLESIMIAPVDIQSGRRVSSESMSDKGSIHSRKSSRSSNSGASNGKGSEVEDYIASRKAVSKAVIVKPRAGLFDGKLVAVITLTSIGGKETGRKHPVLIPESQMFFAGTHIAAVRRDLDASGLAGDHPDFWAVLETMPLNEAGEVERRTLRTWIQNANEELYQRITQLDTKLILQLPATEMEKSLQRLVARILQISPDYVGMNLSFAQLGGDETAAMALVARCRLESIFVSTNDILRSATLSQLAITASQRGGLAHKWDAESTDDFNLSSMQRLYFQTSLGGDAVHRRSLDGSYRFNQSLLLRVPTKFTLDDIAAAVDAVVAHHSMLRARFTSTTEGWKQRIEPEVEGSYGFNHYSISTDEHIESVISQTQAAINVADGPVFTVAHFSTDDGHQMIYIVAHHLVVDLVSWRVIIQDLDELLLNGSLSSHRSMPFQKWIDISRDQVHQSTNSMSFDISPADYQYWGLSNSPNTYGDAAEVSFSLSPEVTSILQTTCNQALQTDSVDIFLAALLLSFSQTFHDRQPPTLWNQEHGRGTDCASIDISDTVGWFTTLCPVAPVDGDCDDFIALLRRLKDQRRSTRSYVPQYFASQLLSLSSDASASNTCPFEIIFSYSGSFQSLVRDEGVFEQMGIPGRTLASKTSDIGPNVGRIALFEVNAMIDEGFAKVRFIYNRNSLYQDRIASWIQNYEHLLLEAIGRLRYHPQELTLSDVPHISPSYDGLAKLNHDRISSLGLSSVREIESILPVTPNQQAILVAQATDSRVCHLHVINEFISPNGDPVDASRICAAWEHVVMRHSALRTVFMDSITDHGLYDALVLRKYSPDMLFIDISPVEDPIESLNSLPIVRSATTPAHRLTVCRAPMKTLVRFDVSSALCDTASVNILFAELQRTYASGRPLPETNYFSCPEYVEYISSLDKASALDFWRERLIGCQPGLFPRLATTQPPHGSEKVHAELGIGFSEISQFSKLHNTTADIVLRLAWGLVLRAFTGSNAVGFGYRATGRNVPVDGVASAVGCFANVVPCTLDLPSHTMLSSILNNIKDQHSASLPYQHATLPEIKHMLGIKGSEFLFNSCLAYTEDTLDSHRRCDASTGFKIRSFLRQESSNFDVFLDAHFVSGKLEVDLDCTILSQSQAYAVANTFGRAIQAVMGAPQSSVGGVDLFSDRDYAQILSWGGDVPINTRSETLLHELVFVQTVQRPDSGAVCALDGDLSYQQLEDHANRLAYLLVDAGVTVSTPVPVFLDRSRWSAVAMLAVIKAGGVLVPIDANDMGFASAVCQHIDAKLAVACDSVVSRLGNLFEKVITLDSELMSSLAGQLHTSEHPPLPLAKSTNDACIFFMPVSPKEVRGIAFTHSALSTVCIAQGPAAGINHSSRVMQLSSFNSDIAIAEIFTTLVHGGCVCMPTTQERFQDFTGAVKRMSVTWSYMTPLLARKLNVELLPTLKTVCFRTRSLDEDTYAPWVGKKKVVLAYGAPELCPLGISFLAVHEPYQLRCLGKPIIGNLWVVNPEDHQKFMPIGALGELMIGGPTLGRAYKAGVHTPTTAENAGGSGPMCFKTGHTVRYTEGGLIEYVASKKDDLVLYGQTVNLGIIEQQLRRCLGHGIDVIVEAISFKDNGGILSLVAFIEFGTLFDGNEDLSKLSKTTKERLRIMKQLVDKVLPTTLPPFMIPDLLIPLKYLPIANSLKINRRKLHKSIQGLSHEQLLSLSLTSSSTELPSIGLKQLPLTETEERMRAVWARVLTLDESSICATDGFIKAGGDDVLAVDLVVTCRQAGLNISIADVLRNATLTDLCRRVTAAADSEALDEVSNNSACDSVQIQPSPSVAETLIGQVIVPRIGVEAQAIQDVEVASATQMRHIEAGMRHGHAGIDYFVFAFGGPVNSKKLEESLHLLVDNHPILRTAFVPYNRKVYQIVLKDFKVEFRKFLCPSWRLTAFAEKVIKKDQNEPSSFHSPPTKFVLLDSGKQSTLIMRLSKAQYDDHSITLFVKDLKRLHDGGENQSRRPTYSEFIRSAQISNTNATEQYWRALLEGASVTQVVAHSKPQQLSSHVKTIHQRLQVGSMSNLGVGFETVLKATWSMVLATLSATSDVVFGELVDGRHVRLQGGQAVSGVLGPAANVIPVRVSFPDYPLSPIGLLQYIQCQRVAGIPYENLGLYELIEKCTPWHYWSRLSTIIQHQHEESAIVAGESRMFRLGASSCTFTMIESKAQDVPDLFVRSIMQSSGDVELAITFCEDRIPGTFAQETLKALCDTVSLITSVSVMQPIIPTGSQYEALARQIPLPQVSNLMATATDAQLQQRLQIKCQVSPDEALMIRSVIVDAWSSILDPRALGVPAEHLENAAFYDLWGSLIPAADFASYFTREVSKLPQHDLDEGTFQITMEDIIEHPTMSRQFELLVRKLYGDPHTKNGADSPSTSMTSRRKSIAVATLGKSIRRLTSTVTRASPTIRHPLAPILQHPAPAAEVISPVTPGGLPAPRLPSLPSFSPVAEEPDPLGSFGSTQDEDAAARPRSNTASSEESAGSLTGGSSASSHSIGEGEDGTFHLHDQVETALRYAEGIDDIVSPLTPVGGKLFDMSGIGAGAADGAKKRMSIFKKRIVSPITLGDQ